ncbi:MAG: YlmC/YmxH family sporulation protein [Clostridia bacterium]|nr:YlmC/YmxH family sporulation protein [Clostridia bacterium]
MCRIDELKNKQVVSVKNGAVLGRIDDIEINTENGSINSVIIFGRNHVLGIFGRENDIIIPWKDIEVIGSETVLVSTEQLLKL